MFKILTHCFLTQVGTWNIDPAILEAEKRGEHIIWVEEGEPDEWNSHNIVWDQYLKYNCEIVTMLLF